MSDRLAYFNQLYEPAKRQRDAVAADWDVYESAYMGEPERTKPKGKGAWRSFVHFKYAWQQTHTLVAAIASEDDPTFKWEARNAQNSQYADTIQGVVGLQFERDDYAEKRFMSVLTAAVYGGCPVKYSWLFVKDADGNVIEDRPMSNPLDPRTFFYDPRARSMREARYAGHEMFLELAELKARTKADGSPLYQNLDQFADGQQSGGDDGYTGELDNDKSGERDKARRKGIHVVELWTRDRLMVRANGVIIRDEPNPMPHGRLPFEVVRLLPSLNDVWGVSLIWALRDPQALIQSLDNAAMDNIKLALDPPRAVDVTDDASNVQREWMPGQVYPSRSPNDAVKTLSGANIDPNSAQAAIGSIRDITKQITGITDELAGQSSADSATQAALNDRAAKGRMGIMLRQVDQAWARVAQGFLALDQKYLDLSVPIKVMGSASRSHWKYVSPKEIAGQWDVRPKNSSERVVKELHRENLMNAINAIGAFAERTTPQGMTIDPTELIGELVETFGIPKERVVVNADMMRSQREKDAVSMARGQAAAMAIAPPPPAPAPMPMPEQGEPSLIEQAQSKLFSSINYKDLPNAAQAAMLDQIGLPAEGVESDDDNPTRPNAGKPPAELVGRSTGQKAKAAVSKKKDDK
jgi:hypothetical protein